MINRQVFHCLYFQGCNTLRTFISPSLLYHFNWFEFSNSRRGCNIGLGFSAHPVVSLSGSSYCAKLWVHFSISMTQTLDYVWVFFFIFIFLFHWLSKKMGICIIYHNKHETSNFFNSAVYACNVFATMLIIHKTKSNTAQLFSRQSMCASLQKSSRTRVETRFLYLV